MKKLLFIILSILLFSSCQTNSEMSSDSTDSTSVDTTTTDSVHVNIINQIAPTVITGELHSLSGKYHLVIGDTINNSNYIIVDEKLNVKMYNEERELVDSFVIQDYNATTNILNTTNKHYDIFAIHENNKWRIDLTSANMVGSISYLQE